MAMMHLLLLLLTQTAPADQVLDRYVAFRKANPNLEVVYSSGAGGAMVQGTALLEGRKRLYMTFKANNLDYVAAITPKAVIELDRKNQTYDEHEGMPQVQLSESRLTNAVSLFPSWLYLPDLRNLLPKNTPFMIDAKETVDGVVCDRIVASYTGNMGEMGKVEAAVDGKGAIRRLRVASQSPMGSKYFDWKIGALRPMKPADAVKFNLALPVGYSPYALPQQAGPVGVGEPFPTSGWTSAAGGSLDVKAKLGAKGGLVALLGEESEPSQRSAASLGRLRGEVPVVVLTDAPHKAAGTDGYDATGATLRKLSAPGTPLFALLDGNGNVVKLWMGYDPDAASAFETEVRNAFNGKE